MKIQYCPYCGTKLDDGARFCKNCGEPITETTHRQQEAKREEPFNRNRTERKTVYEGRRTV